MTSVFISRAIAYRFADHRARRRNEAAFRIFHANYYDRLWRIISSGAR
jgi:hypothetical protein